MRSVPLKLRAAAPARRVGLFRRRRGVAAAHRVRVAAQVEVDHRAAAIVEHQDGGMPVECLRTADSHGDLGEGAVGEAFEALEGGDGRVRLGHGRGVYGFSVDL